MKAEAIIEVSLTGYQPYLPGLIGSMVPRMARELFIYGT